MIMLDDFLKYRVVVFHSIIVVPAFRQTGFTLVQQRI